MRQPRHLARPRSHALTLLCSHAAAVILSLISHFHTGTAPECSPMAPTLVGQDHRAPKQPNPADNPLAALSSAVFFLPSSAPPAFKNPFIHSSINASPTPGPLHS